MPIFVFLRSSLFFGARQRPGGKALILGLFLRRDARKKPQQCAAASALRCVRHQRTMSPARARNACRGSKAHFALLVSYRPLALIIFWHIEQGR